MLSSRARRAFPLYICCLTTFTSVSALADNTLFTAMDDPATAKKPFEGNVQAGYNAQSGNSQSSTLLANTNMTWFNTDAAYSLWGQPTTPPPPTCARPKSTRPVAVRAIT